MIWPLNLFGTL